MAARPEMPEGEALYRSLSDALTEGVLLFDDRGRLLQANPAAVTLMAREDREDETGRVPDVETYDADGTPLPQERWPLTEALRTGEPVLDRELGLLRDDGAVLWVRSSAVPVPGRGGRRQVVVLMRDITAERATRMAVQEREERFRLLAENATDVVYRTDGAGVCLWVSPSVRHLLGYEPEGLVGGPLDRLYHPDDRPVLEEARRVVRRGGAPQVEIRVVSADGEVRWCSARAQPFRDDAGRVTGRIVTLRDIHDTVRAREELAASEELFRQALAHAPIGMALVAPDGRFLAANDALAVFLGRSREELLAGTLADLVGDEDVIPRMLDGRSTSYAFEREYHRHGARLHGRVSTTAVRGADGAVAYLVVQVQDLSAEREAERQLSWLAFHDAMTELPNRERVARHLSDLLLEVREYGGLVAVLFVDVDHLKTVNDSLGHAAGDLLLRETAARLVAATPAGTLVGRVGGDEFVVVLPVLDAEEAELVAESMDEAARARLPLAGHVLSPSVSIGLAVVDGRTTAAEVLRDADTALFAAKAAGRGRWLRFDGAMRQEALARLSLEDELRRAVERDQLVVHYEPVHRIDGGGLAGLEALVRWRHPRRGLLAPSQFLHLVEESGHMAALSRLVLDRACVLLARHPRERWYVAVNVSAVQLGRADFATTVREVVSLYAVDPHRVVLEITESGVLHLSDSARRELVGLAELGVRFFVDDFGTGFSAVSHLRDLPVAGLKLDRSFVADLTAEDSPANRLVEGLAGLARGLGLIGVAEGVAAPEQARLLQDLGWELAQGELFGTAQPERDLELTLKELHRR